MAIKLIIADDMPEMRETIVNMLSLTDNDYDIVACCENGEQVLKVLAREVVDMVLMDINMPVMNGLEATEAITNLYPLVSVVMMSVQHESEYLKKAMFAGAKAYIMKPIDIDELTQTINTTFDRSKVMVNHSNTPVKKGKIFSFYSGKGGVGQTVIALNTAMLLAKEQKLKVLLLDLDMRYGDIALLLNRQSDLTLQDMLADASPEAYTTYAHEIIEGCEVVFAPKSPEAAEYILKEAVLAYLDFAQTKYDYIFVDLGVNYDDVTLSVLDISHKILLVSSQEVTALKDTKLCLKILQTLNHDVQKIKLIINMSDQKHGVAKTTVEKAFDIETLGFIPDEPKAVRVSINTGEPLALHKSQLHKPLLQLCRKMIHE